MPEKTVKVIRRLQAYSSAIRRTFVQHFTRFQLTACSCGASATAGLLVSVDLEAFMLLVVLKHFSVVKEEIIDDQALLPSYNGRVVTWVCFFTDTILMFVHSLLLYTHEFSD